MNKFFILTAACLFSFLLINGCADKSESGQGSKPQKTQKIFEQLSSTNTALSFSNDLKEDSVINYFTYPYIYMGGGIAVGDVNNDGLQDLYFTGNMVDNKLYLNKGNMQFEDVTEVANVAGDDRWMTGVTMVDINTDGWLDIYVSVSGKFTTKENLLYVNNGPDENGVPTFSEEAKKYGIADDGSSTQGTFFDYDKDGDLDLYVANYPYTNFKTTNFTYAMKIQKKSLEDSDRLYENNGNGSFTDVTEKAGLLSFGLSLSATVGDFNNDGWEDIYVSNDFATPDYFYLNNGDGTFSEKVKETTQHTAFFGMGADAGDFNNDGLLDLIQMDMTPEDNRRNKANMASMNIPRFWEVVNMGMGYQYMQNALQLNQGISEDGLPHFSDISRLANMASTDWSWASLFADLDNDGWKDIFITNGTRRDINNKDYFKKMEKATYEEKQNFNYLELTKNMPSQEVDNYALKNNGDLSFENVVESWGLSFKGFSNGAVYADLDNDGDLDLVVNNIDENASLFKNKSSELNSGGYLRVKLNGNAENPLGVGAKVFLHSKAGMQYQHSTLSRGFQSSVEPIIHFGLGKENAVDDLTVIWPDGKFQTIANPPVNQVMTVEYAEAQPGPYEYPNKKTGPKIFAEVSENIGIDFKHIENAYDDFAEEILLPHEYSKNGPALAVGDVNDDQLEDFYVGGAIGQSGMIYLQNAGGEFTPAEVEAFASDAKCEDMGANLFDVDSDGDLDLYVVSGGNEYKNGAPELQDRLYLNNGKGEFIKSENALPELQVSGSRVAPADYDSDGDLDLFVGGRVVPGSYPLPAKSYILKNESKDGNVSFVDVTEKVAPEFSELGLVTDAEWVDFDSDGILDIVITGEWMPVSFFKNNGEAFINMTAEYGMGNNVGWWYSVLADDFDGDGDADFMVGNLGLNYKYRAEGNATFDVYADDFDKNGKLDIVLGYFNDGVQYPVRGRQCSSEQIPAIKVKYKDYNSFAEASLEDIYTKEDLENALHYQANNFASGYIENLGGGKFQFNELPNLTQISSINDFVAGDFNNDGHMDVLAAGNLFSSEIETTRNDAGYGCFLQGDGNGNFTALSFAESGLLMGEDTKDIALINTVNGLVVLAANNNDKMKAFMVHTPVQ